MTWVWSALVPHPPVLVAEVGHGREREAAATLDGLERLRSEIRRCNKDQQPQFLLILSPHAPYVPGKLFLNSALKMTGTLARFGASRAAVAIECPTERADHLALHIHQAGIPVERAEVQDISPDHGSIVPLLLLQEAFPEAVLPPAMIANPSGLSADQALALGRALGSATFLPSSALLASGDLSHRLMEDGPYGFNPDGPVFDQTVLDALAHGSPAPLLGLSPTVLKNAAECGLRPVLAMLGLTGGEFEVFSYESPFGIGYCTAFRTAVATSTQSS